MVWSPLVAAAVVLAPVSAQQFNLVCTGEVTKIAIGSNVTSAYSRTLRIDLSTGQWCAEACAAVEPIARIEPARLVLTDVKRDTPREYWVERESVDRVTGEHSGMAGSNPTGPHPRSAFSKGACIKAPFTGFGSQGRKF